jgi:hypothetical protein
MSARIVALGLGLVASTARAEHHHGMAMGAADEAPRTQLDAGVALVAASYGTTSYVGNYEGVIPSLDWDRGRYKVGASLGLYRILLNGLDQHGIGDVMVHAGVLAVARHDLTVGATLMVSAPTGDDRFGLGMGHPMAMPAAFGAWAAGRLTLSASAGFSRAIAHAEEGHDHGVWPLVEPMNMSEITWGAGCDVLLGSGLHGMARAGGGIPVGLPGHARVIGALRLGWGTRRIDTSAEVQTGFVGDPFTVRGLVETALHF